jgi:hypothetical protein
LRNWSYGTILALTATFYERLLRDVDKNKANIPEIVFGALLVVAIFSVGTVFESSRMPVASDNSKQSADHRAVPVALENASDKTTDWLLVGLNLFLVVSTFMLWRATSKSAQIAERTLVDLERPWLFLAGATIRRRDLPGQPLTPNFWFIKLHWKNVGRSPALTQECIFECKPKVGLPAEPVYSNDHPGLNLPYTVAAGDTVETSEVGPAPGQNEILVFYGRLTYTELNGKSHQTGFSVEVSPHIAAFSPYAGKKYDYYT